MSWFRKVAVEKNKFDKVCFRKKHNVIYPGFSVGSSVSWDTWQKITYSGTTVLLPDSKLFECKTGNEIEWVDENELRFPTSS